MNERKYEREQKKLWKIDEEIKKGRTKKEEKIFCAI